MKPKREYERNFSHPLNFIAIILFVPMVLVHVSRLVPVEFCSAHTHVCARHCHIDLFEGTRRPTDLNISSTLTLMHSYIIHLRLISLSFRIIIVTVRQFKNDRI